jgi:predicted unusual protein kinase regulating ubiquinone biosynthesis (AarF/ABC1/UbiB family)
MSDFRRPERDSLLGRARRVATVGANLGAAAAAFGVNRIVKSDDADARIARALKDALGRTKGPLMKIAQLVSTIPDAPPNSRSFSPTPPQWAGPS